MFEKFNNLGIKMPNILLPNSKINMNKWSVVACDQYTSEPEYWEKVKSNTTGEYSTYNMVLPEVYLEEENVEEKINLINNHMTQYLKSDVFVEHKDCFVLIERYTEKSGIRKGLLISIDLDKYEYTKGNSALIRATENTVVERLPPRIKIRENAPLELPHILLLVDDPDKKIIEPIFNDKENLEKIYDFDLMLDGGTIKGYKVSKSEHINQIEQQLQKLSSNDNFCKKYDIDETHSPMLFAVGDGNHSLAAAKCHWENVKKNLSKEEVDSHPAKYALVELINLHDDGLNFEPIHRVAFNIDFENFINYSNKYFTSLNSKLIVKLKHELIKEEFNNNCHFIEFYTQNLNGYFIINDPTFNLEVGTLQNLLDSYLNENPDVKIDYIHGSDVVLKLGSQQNNIGFLLPSLDKRQLFKTVILEGALPRKTFSMGEAEEKRFYLECRKIL